MNDTDSNLAMNAICYAAEMTQHNIAHSASCISDALTRPSAIYKPALSIDGNQWCALYGENLQNGVAGFGDSPADAMAAFDKAWTTKIGAKP
jgi:CII-binding regulator of phage lambda lysogenization HflD